MRERNNRLDGAPVETGAELSIVVASMNGFPYLGMCLSSLRDHCGAAEVIVADCTGEQTRRRVRNEFPSARLVRFDEWTAVPILRAAGITAAQAPYVAVLEDACVVTPDWSRKIIETHRSGHPVVGGSIRNGATRRIRDWAAFFCEYSEYLDPVPSGAQPTLLGMNVSYDRRALAAIEELLPAGHWEFPLHARLRSHGFELHSDPTIRIDYIKEYGFCEFLVQCFAYSRSFARMRSASLGRRRILYAVGSLLLVPYLYFRVVRNVMRRRRHRTELVLATPLIIVYLGAWGLGEMLGYASRSPPDVRMAA